MPIKNSITIQENGNITLQDANSGQISIDTTNVSEAVKGLKQLNEAQLDSLLQIAEQQKGQFSELYKTLLNGVAGEKNVVKGSITNIKGDVNIGDRIIYNYYYTDAKLAKELTVHLPKIHPDDIIGREEVLIQLHQLLSVDQRVVVVNGIGGSGKTTLAQVYISKYYYEYEHIVWITQSSQGIASDFINASGLLNNLKISTTNLEPGDIFEEIVRKLKSIEDKPNLLIIDNAEQSLKKYKDMLPGPPQWHLLVTSREDLSGFYLKPLDFLTEEQAIKLFKKHYTHKSLKEQNIKDLVISVDYHTLTIEILAKTAQVHRYDAITLKQAIESDIRANVEIARQSDLVEKVGTYLRSIFNLSKLSRDEIWLMKQLTCLPPNFYLYDLLYELIIGEEDLHKNNFSENLSELAKKGWLLYNKADEDSYKLHRIIAEVVKKEHPVIVADVKQLIAVVNLKLSLEATGENWYDKFVWIPYGKSLFANFSEDLSPEIVELGSNLAVMLQDFGDFEEAKEILEKIVFYNEKNRGTEHVVTIDSYVILGSVLNELGEYERAKRLFEKVTDYSEKTYGTKHPKTGTSYFSLARVAIELGDDDEAKILLKKAVRIAEINFGTDPAFTAASYTNIGVLLLNNLEDYEGGMALLEKAIEIGENISDSEQTSTARYYLAMILKALGDLEGAKKLSEKEVQIAEKNFGTEHVKTATRYNNLAMILLDLGDYSKALELSSKALSIYEKVLPEGHQEIAGASVTYQYIRTTIEENNDN